MTWTVALVPTEAVPDIWPTVSPMLEPAVAMSNGRMTMEAVVEWLADRRYLLWIGYPENKIVRVAFLTRTAVYPGRKMLAIDCCGGSGRLGWVNEGTQVFKSFARDLGLDGVELVGRVGWQKALKSYGWGTLGVVIETGAAA